MRASSHTEAAASRRVASRRVSETNGEVHVYSHTGWATRRTGIVLSDDAGYIDGDTTLDAASKIQS